MKGIGMLLIMGGLAFAIGRGLFHFYVYNEYVNEIGCHWDLADRASTIAQKSEYIDKYVAALEECKLDGVHNALFYPNDENSFTANMKALKSLQRRLKDISTMDENSFAYQTAMHQITEQEQGQANDMLNNLASCWLKDKHYFSWNPFIMLGFLIIQIVMIVWGFNKL